MRRTLLISASAFSLGYLLLSRSLSLKYKELCFLYVSEILSKWPLGWSIYYTIEVSVIARYAFVPLVYFVGR